MSSIEEMDSIVERDRVGVQDAVLLHDYKSEEAFVENLRKRFNENLIYTYIGQVLISVNPYKHLPIYGQNTVAEYQRIHMFERPPHIYAITDVAYRSLTEEQRNQCILISGESGAGKTEASKKILEYVAAVSDNRGEVKTVKDKLLQSNPVLEAFGNAKTNRNNNSSRFGKYMDIQFSNGNPIGGNILNYLLEKSRVIRQSPGERNFHIFYLLLSEGEESLLKDLQLERNPKNYKYFSHWVEGSPAQVPDAPNMTDVLNALSIMGLTGTEQKEIMLIVATVLHLGNIGVADVEGKTELQNDKHIRAAAKLLGCDYEALYLALSERTIIAHGDSVKSPLTPEMAVFARDALAKAIYDRLFTWLVSRLNKSLQPQHKRKTSLMGILDIYGFEIFERNSFEQFCINYCNEKMQQLFIELTLKSEQEEYLREGIEWESVDYFNNNIIISLIEERHKGIIALLDEECLRPGEPSDATFLSKMSEQLSAHDHFVSHKKADTKVQKIMSREEFKLIHYAGEVVYNTKGFIEKNKDLLFRDLRQVMSDTSNSITKTVFTKTELKSKRRPETAVTQFKTSLNHLMDILMTKEPSYVRCIKPNDFQKPGIFTDELVSHQVKYLGLMENLRVRRAGFAYRRVYKDFLSRYKSLSRRTWPSFNGSDKEGVQYIMTDMKYTHEDYRMGNTKIFIRYANTLFKIEDAYQARKHELVAQIQAHWRGHVQREKYKRMRAAAIVIQKNVRRCYAIREAKQRKAAAKTIREFIEGFITRNGEPSDLNRRFIRTAKAQFLLRLARSLPRNLLSTRWPTPPAVCEKASQELRVLHRRWLARNYRHALSPEMKSQLEQKVLAESLFKDKKKSYPDSIGPRFVDNRLTDTQNLIKNNFLSNYLQNGDRLLYSCAVVKFDRRGYKRRDRALLLTNSSICVVVEEGKSFKIKEKLFFHEIVKFEVTSEKDNFLLIRVAPNLPKQKGDLILEVPHLIEVMTKMIQVMNNPELLNVNSIESGTISFNFSGGKQGVIDLTKGNNGPSISKGKTGQLIVVG